MRVLAAAAAVAASLLVPTAVAANVVDARLDGEFGMKGVITRADRVPGEHKGQKVARTWLFTSKCSAGPCDSVVLHRHRTHHKVDRMVLDRVRSGEYFGKGKFFFPIRCAGVVRRHGGEARVEIDVKITAADADGNATDVRATYRNPRRINHTECGSDRDLGRDGARYTGHLRAGS